jgi:hypothetical protein
MKLEKNEIYTIKLASGEEIVTKIVDQTDNAYEADQPIMVVVSQQGLQLMPGLFTNNNEKTVTINKSNCVMIGSTREDVRTNWIEATTGISTETKQIVTG